MLPRQSLPQFCRSWRCSSPHDVGVPGLRRQTCDGIWLILRDIQRCGMYLIGGLALTLAVLNASAGRWLGTIGMILVALAMGTTFWSRRDRD